MKKKKVIDLAADFDAGMVRPLDKGEKRNVAINEGG
jgi:hypothetical protein